MNHRGADLGDFELQARAFAIASDRARSGFVNPYTVWYVGRMLAADRARCDAILGRCIGLVRSPLRVLGRVPDVTNEEMEFLRAYDECTIEARNHSQDETGRGWSL